MTFDIEAMREAKKRATLGPWKFEDDLLYEEIGPYVKGELVGKVSVENIWDKDLIEMASDMADEIERLTAALATARADALNEALIACLDVRLEDLQDAEDRAYQEGVNDCMVAVVEIGGKTDKPND